MSTSTEVLNVVEKREKERERERDDACSFQDQTSIIQPLAVTSLLESTQ
jgi:hypothetical protein